MSSDAQQMACCKNGHHTCGRHGTPADCCKRSASQPSHATVINVTSLKAPVPTVIVWTELPIPTGVTLNHRGILGIPSPPNLPLSPPAYIAFSTLLI